MEGARSKRRVLERATIREKNLAGRDALIALVRLLARQAAGEVLAEPRREQESNRNDNDDE
jgi:hypothetical protein